MWAARFWAKGYWSGRYWHPLEEIVVSVQQVVCFESLDVRLLVAKRTDMRLPVEITDARSLTAKTDVECAR